MPTRYTRTTQQQTWDSEAMEKAIRAVRNGEMGFLKASTVFGDPRSTLKWRVQRKNKHAVENVKILGSRRPIFSPVQEAQLVQHILELENRFYGLTLRDVRKLAFQLAERNNIKHNFNKDTQMAGKAWASDFRKRHPELTLRSPEATSLARAQGFNKVSVTKYFDLLEEVRSKTNYPPHRIFNVDESGFTTVQSKSSKVLAKKGKKQVGAITSAERGVLSTVVICMAAGGNFIPPFIIFPRKRMKVELQDGAPPGTGFACHSSGWMQLDIFTAWFKHFLKFAKPTEDDPALLILDGHNSHTKNLDFIDMARRNHTTVLCLPPHCSHRLQPLDVSFMGPLNKYYIRAVEKYLRNNPGRALTVFQFSKLFGEAYSEAAQQSIAINGFRKCGVEPMDRHVFKDYDFVPADTTDNILLEQKLQQNEANNENETPERVESPSILQVTPPTLDQEENINVTLPVTSPILNPYIDLQPSTSFAVAPEDLFPIPKALAKIRKINRKRGRTAILTSSPYKNELPEEKTQQQQKKRTEESD
ncbi:unnamed protein product [Acanthoscelides obtectus]|uniref:HTH CENPB-type domain-containing protein n=1 Tax=Acanthoscelides obtectus TaxID=200917 RepID=A0A9P0K071_ACAOB|nr:unnamed protein product [Acanthoscelides obtectus]CAK1633776.1 Pogo transposable element with KRAB domain [Acanthoscelides obtectus]